MLKTVILLAALAPAAAAAAAAPIASGTYHCKAGSSRLMLTLGDMTISGSNYVFNAPNGEITRGTYSVTPTGYQWNGPISAIKREQIVKSGPDASPGYFWFSYRIGSSSPTTASCGRL